MVGKNNNYIRESKSNEHFQRFSLRKLSVGVVSVAVAAGFYLGSGATAQAATTEPDTSAKTEQVVQKDATSAVSDATSASNSSAASASSATPVSAESASSVAVSDSPASASAASDNQASAANASESSSQPASSSVASDAASAVSEKSQAASEANSQSAADKQTAQLPTSAANVNESQASNILNAQVVQQAANQQAPAGFTVTDPDYPAGMYRDDKDASHYTYWWAQSSDGNYNLVLSTDRNGDGKVYVFLLGRNNNVLGQYTVDKNDSADVIFDYGLRKYSFGTVYNDGQSGVFVSSGRTWKSKFNVFDPEASKDNGDYGSISFMIPQVETQTTTYVDDKGNTVSIDPVVQKGLDGQSYTTQGGKVIKGYFAKEPSNASGYMSPFGKQGATYTKDWHDGLKATFTETDTKTGLMHVVVEYKGEKITDFDLAYGESKPVEYSHYEYSYYDHSYHQVTSKVTIHSIYIKQTINIQYVYEKLGNLIIDSDSKAFPAEDKTTKQYPNDENDSTKAGNVTIPKVPGFTPTINGKTVTNYTFNPVDYVSDLSQDITVVYTANTQKATVTYIDDTTGKTLETKPLTGNSDTQSDYTTKDTIKKYTDQHYVLVSDDTKGQPITFDHDDKSDQTFVVHLKHDTQDANDSRTKTLIVHYQYADKNKAADDRSAASLTFTRKGTKDLVTGDTTWQAWDQPSQTFATVESPTIPGYTPDQTAIDGVAVNADSPAQTEKTVTYTADAQKATVTYIDDTTGKTLKTTPLSGKTNAKSGYTTANDIQAYKDLGYVLVSDSTNGAEIVFDNDDAKDQTFEVHLKHGTTHTNATDENAEQKTVTETIHYVYENNQTAQPDYTAAVTFKRGYTTDNVTGKVVSYDPWTIDGKQADSKTFAAVTSPTVEGYTPNHKQINEFTVTPDSKDIVKTVVYVGDPQEAQAIFYDETTGKEISNTREIVNGKTDEAISFTKDPDEVVKELEKQGYVFDKDNANNNVFVAGTTYDKNSEVHQYFKYYFTHATTIVTPDNPKTPADVLPDNPGKNYPSGVAKDDLNKTVTRTINITTPDGKTQTITQKAEFTRSATVDEVTGEVTYGPWSKNVVLESVDVPNIPGYVPSASVPEITVTPNDQDMTINITYKKLDSGKATDQGGNASNGGQATNGGSTTGQSAQNGQSGQTQNNAGAQQLPQTGNANNEKGALGLAGAMFAAGLGLGFGSKKKRHEN